MTAIRVALRLIQSAAWQGGYNYLLNLGRVVERFKPTEISMFIFAGDDACEQDLQPFRELLGERVIIDPAFHPPSIRRRQLWGALWGSDETAERILSSHHIDVVFENADFYGWRFPIPTIAWMPDFQHKHFPHLIGRKQTNRREIGFRLQIATGRTLMVSSEDAKQDLQRFYRLPAERIVAVPFATPFTQPPSQSSMDAVVQKYDLPERFLICPNQFHAHKNHITLAKAVAELVKVGRPVTVVCPGGAGGGVGLTAWEELQAFIRTHDLQTNFRLPGRIPGDDLRNLFAASKALVNPSLFEGWSTTVEEAIAIGLPLLLSDLRVNREQAGSAATYFDPRSSADIARTIVEFELSPPPERPSTAELAELANQRLMAFADKFEACLRTCIVKRKNQA